MKNKNNVHVISLSNYVQPIIVESQSKDYVTYGKKNSYFQYLIDRSNGSTTNAAAIQFMIKLIFGDGLTASNKAIKTQEYAAMKGLFSNKDVRRIVDDFKRLGHAIIQVTYKGKHKAIDKASHFPVELIAPKVLKENEDEIQGFYYPKNMDWAKLRSKSDLEFVPAFGTSKEGIEFLYIKTYSPGLFYFSVVDYSSALQWAETEEEVANFHINNIQNGFAPSMMINFNNGTPDEEQQRIIVNKTRKTLQGSTNTGTAIIAFNDNKENAGTIEPVILSNASEQYQFVSTEAKQQILTGHRIPSPLLLGIPSGSGFSSTSDELKTAFTLLEHQEAMYFREILIDSFDKILAFNNISLDLEFESLNPFDDGKQEIAEGLKLNAPPTEYDEEPSGTIADGAMFDSLKGEDEDLTEWEIIDERDVDYDVEDAMDEDLKQANLSVQLANTGKAHPDKKSLEDGEGVSGTKYKVRYQYSPLQISNNSRPFCKMMVNAKKIYRKEDIIAMGNQPVNAGWGKGGADTYSVWKFKGGGGCHHKWVRKTYARRQGDPIKSIATGKADQVTVESAKRDGFRPKTNESIVSIRPSATPTGQFLDGREWTPKTTY